MQTIIAFLQRVLPSANFYAGFAESPNKDKQQKAFDSIEDLASWVAYQAERGWSAHYGLSGFAQAWHAHPLGKTNSDGTPKQVFRTKENAVAQRAFWFDIDVGDDKPYKTQEDAIATLQEFLVATHFPVPYLISSGYGIHGYWMLTEQLPTSEWLPHAIRLEALLYNNGVQIDLSKTSDPSAMLRPPNTYNIKDPTNPKAVTVLNDAPAIDTHAICSAIMAQTQHMHVATIQKPAITNPALGGLAGNADFMSAMGWMLENKVVVDRDPIAIVTGCQQIREAGTQIEPVWFNMMTVAKYCIDGETMVHAISQADPRYDAWETTEKFQYAKETGGGPAVCETFNKLCPNKCTACPYYGKITSPVELGRTRAEQEAVTFIEPPKSISTLFSEMAPDVGTVITIPPIKDNRFEIIPNDGIYVIYEEPVKKGEPETITRKIKMCDAELYPMCVHIYIDSATKRTTRYFVWRKILSGGAPEDILMTDDEASNPRAQTRWLSNNALMPLNGLSKMMGAYMLTYLSQCQNILPEIYVKEHFGWTDAKGAEGAMVEGFVLGDTMYIPGMTPQPVNLSAKCQQMAEKEYGMAGDLETWKEIPKMYSVLDQKEAQFAICAGFAAPFMRFSNGTATNAVINLWEPTGGVGKSTILNVVNSIWGHPKHQMLEQDDTEVARYMVAGTRRNLPICMDEMTMAEDRVLSRMLYMMANGRERRKGISGTELAKTGDWSTIFLMTSNNSVLDKMMKYSAQAQAQIMRAMDVRVSLGAPTEMRPYIEHTISLLSNNYGLAGRYFMERVMENPAILTQLPKLLQEWNLEASNNSAERFWVYGCAVILLIGNLAKSFGLIDFDMDALEQWTQDLLDKLRKAIQGAKTDAASMLVDFLNDKHAATVTVASSYRPANQPDACDAVTSDLWCKRMPVGNALDVRYELDTHTIYVRAKALRQWCKDNNISMDTLMGGLVSEGIWNPNSGTVRFDLGRGVKLLGRGQAQCYMFKNLTIQIPEGVENGKD